MRLTGLLVLECSGADSSALFARRSIPAIQNRACRGSKTRAHIRDLGMTCDERYFDVPGSEPIGLATGA